MDLCDWLNRNGEELVGASGIQRFPAKLASLESRVNLTQGAQTKEKKLPG
jgi:hypothetical protein